MNLHKKLGLVVIVAAALLILSTGVVFATVLNQVGPWWLGESEGNGEYWGPMHGRRGDWSAERPFPPMHAAMIEAVADATGLTVDEIELRHAEGERLIAIALDAGMTEEAFFDLMTETRATFLAEALEAGWITPEQYRWMLERKVNPPDGLGFGGCHRFNTEGDPTIRRGPGMGRGRRW